MTRKSNFSSFSHGFQPGHRQQNALDAFTARIKSRKVNWIVDADIRSFNEIDHEWMLRFLAHRIADQRIRRLIRRWLNAVVIGEGQREPAVKGTPQGAGTSPWLANLYRRCAFSLRIQPWPTSPGRGGFIVLRSADYRLVGFEAVRTARASVEALREPLAKFGLSLHPEKTRSTEFGGHAVERMRKRAQDKPETFDLLGFTHCLGTNQQGQFQVVR